ncbi:MarR family transcriptional regulator [Streptomyces sp. NBC_01708]|uniref:MarR family transcriptional regulator n=1 Tax=Streptomyces sp. NBC_01708 TaxID=2975915 RepID=UPI002E2F241A|nr:MarR family transcriptional regulator [Streptomyces sp. NBC_01708]
MATQHISSASRTPAPSRPYPMASPGYGKRTMPDQHPRTAADFTLLPARERQIAGFIEQLPDGAAMDVKSLAKQLPLYGQQAVGSALKALSTAGYLRRVRCLVGEPGQVRWVFRTFWSRTAQDNEWWAATEASLTSAPAAAPAPPVPLAAPAPPAPAALQPVPPALVATPAPEPAPPALAGSQAAPTAPAAPTLPQQRTPVTPTAPVTPAPDAPSPAYLALARLGRIDSRLALSATDCAALEARAAEWLARGVDTDYLTQALVAGLPERVSSPVGLVRRRLTDKIPPHAPAAPTPPAPDAPVHRVMLECTRCGTPGRPEALPDGLCRPCRTPGQDTAPVIPADRPGEQDVRTLAAGLRDLLKSP